MLWLWHHGGIEQAPIFQIFTLLRSLSGKAIRAWPLPRMEGDHDTINSYHLLPWSSFALLTYLGKPFRTADLLFRNSKLASSEGQRCQSLWLEVSMRQKNDVIWLSWILTATPFPHHSNSKLSTQKNMASHGITWHRNVLPGLRCPLWTCFLHCLPQIQEELLGIVELLSVTCLLATKPLA